MSKKKLFRLLQDCARTTLKSIEILANFFAVIALALVSAVLMAMPTMSLWNGPIKTIFGLAEIGIWQALGLNVLAAICFLINRKSRQ